MAVSETARLIASLELKDLFSKTADKALKDLDRVDKKIDGTQSRAYKAGTQIGTGIKRGIAIAGGALVGFSVLFEKSLRSASDLNESVSKVGVVFRNAAPSILAFGKTASTALGLSEQAADEAAATFGNLFVALKLPQQASVDMSKRLVTLAADLASFNNVDPTEALDALRSGLVGESEPLRKFGVNLNEASLKAEAVKLGLVSLTKGQKTYTAVLDPATKAQAAYALILDQTKTAQGDFGRTSGGMANQLRILKANWEDFKATLATPALPAVAGILQKINALLKENQPQVAAFGQKIAGLLSKENIEAGFGFLARVFDTIKVAAPVLERSAQATFTIVKAAVDLFNTLPEGIKELAVGAFAINKLTGGLVTNIVGGLAGGLGKVLGKTRGASPANPLFVSDVTGGIKGAAGKAGAAAAVTGGVRGIASKVANIASKVFLIGAAVGVFAELAGILKDQSEANKQTTSDLLSKTATFIRDDPSRADLQKALDQVNAQLDTSQDTIADIPRELALSLNIDGIKTTLEKERADLVAAIGRLPQAKGLQNPILDRGGREQGRGDTNITVGGFDRRIATAVIQGFSRMIAALKAARGTDAIRAAVREAVDRVIGKRQGNVDATRQTVAALRSALQRTHDPKLQAEIKAALAKVQAKIPGREFAARQIAIANKALADGKLTKAETARVKKAIDDLKNRGLPHAAQVIRDKVAASGNSIVRAAGATTAAVKNQDLSVTVPVNVSIRDFYTAAHVQYSIEHNR